jgi:hypothetical protein
MHTLSIDKGFFAFKNTVNDFRSSLECGIVGIRTQIVQYRRRLRIPVMPVKYIAVSDEGRLRITAKQIQKSCKKIPTQVLRHFIFAPSLHFV